MYLQCVSFLYCSSAFIAWNGRGGNLMLISVLLFSVVSCTNLYIYTGDFFGIARDLRLSPRVALLELQYLWELSHFSTLAALRIA